MKLFLCDWCDKQKGCKPMTIDGKSYDICAECRSEIGAKLSGKGEQPESPLKQFVETFGKQKPWPENPTPRWTLEHPPVLIKTVPEIYGPKIYGKSETKRYTGGILC